VNERERSAGLAETPGYRYAEAVGDQLFVAGQVPHDPSGAIVGRDPRAQARQCLDNLRRLVELHGFSLTEVRRLVVYVVGEGLDEAWAATRDWFVEALGDAGVPPATLLGVARLGHRGQLVEIDATIVRQPSDTTPRSRR
jgi:enamine deaminase RidA (YjgF/YER057c/UK114 family)